MTRKFRFLWVALQFPALILLIGCSSHQDIPALAPPPAAAASVPSQIRGGEISSDRPLPPPNYGLYVYVLPGREVSHEIRAEIALFHCDRLTRAGPRDTRRQTTLFVVPVHPRASLGTAARVDVALSADLLRTRVANPDQGDIYVVATATPIRLGPAVRVDAPADKVISVGSMSPSSVSKWLLRLAGAVQQGDLAGPRTIDLRVEDGLLAIGAGARLVGVPVAETSAAPVCRSS